MFDIIVTVNNFDLSLLMIACEVINQIFFSHFKIQPILILSQNLYSENAL